MQYSRRFAMNIDNKYVAKSLRWYSNPMMARAQLHALPETIIINEVLKHYKTDSVHIILKSHKMLH